MDIQPPKLFVPDERDTTGDNWQASKQSFQVYIIAKGLEDASGKRKVNILLHLLGPEGNKLYNTFEFRAPTGADVNRGIAADPGENKENIDTVLAKFDYHYSHKKYRNVKRQAFLHRNQQEGENLMDFVADLKHKAKQCHYGPIEDSLLCDRIIQGCVMTM